MYMRIDISRDILYQFPYSLIIKLTFSITICKTKLSIFQAVMQMEVYTVHTVYQSLINRILLATLRRQQYSFNSAIFSGITRCFMVYHRPVFYCEVMVNIAEE